MRTRWVWALPLVAVGFLAWLMSSEILGPPDQPQRAPGQLTMPGEMPPAQVERAQNQFVALRMDGTLLEVGADQVLIGRGEGQPDAVIFVSPDTTYMLAGRPVTVDEIPLGGDVVATYDLEGARRIATRIDAMPPNEGPPPPDAAAPITPKPPGARLKNGLPSNTSPAQPPKERPRKVPE